MLLKQINPVKQPSMHRLAQLTIQGERSRIPLRIYIALVVSLVIKKELLMFDSVEAGVQGSCRHHKKSWLRNMLITRRAQATQLKEQGHDQSLWERSKYKEGVRRVQLLSTKLWNLMINNLSRNWTHWEFMLGPNRLHSNTCYRQVHEDMLGTIAEEFVHCGKVV